jgi:hypothetical protein
LPRTTTPGCGGTHSYDQQAINALRMQISTGRLHENVIRAPDFGTGRILPAPSDLVQ